MAELTIIVGMAGSGKSSLCDEIAQKSKPHLAVFKDGTLTHNEDRRAGHGCLGEMVARLLGRDESCVMDESHLTDLTFRRKFRKFCIDFLPNVKLKWIYFRPQLLECINNVYHDDQTKAPVKLSRFKALEAQSTNYAEPDEQEWPGTRLDVYKREDPKFATKEKALEWVRSKIVKLTEPAVGGGADLGIR